MLIFIPHEISEIIVDIILVSTIIVIPILAIYLYRIKIPDDEESRLSRAIFKMKMEIEDMHEKQREMEIKINFVYKRILSNENIKNKDNP